MLIVTMNFHLYPNFIHKIQFDSVSEPKKKLKYNILCYFYVYKIEKYYIFVNRPRF